MKHISKLSLLFFTIFALACTDLSEQILDESLSGGAKAENLAINSIAPAYAMLPGLYIHTRYFALQEISTDEAILPYRGGRDWGDNGIYIELHQHTYTPNHSNVNQCWNYLTGMISRTVTAINVLTPLAESTMKQKFLAEARDYAHSNMLCLDLGYLV